MFDIRKILTRSWHILWNYRVLWIFGLALALGAGGRNAGGSGSNYSIGSDEFNPPSGSQTPEGWWEENVEGHTFAEGVEAVVRQIGIGIEMFRAENPEVFQMAVAAAIVAFIVILIFGTVIAVAHYVSQTAVIRMVDEYEETGVKVGFRQGWRYGWNRSALRLFFVNFLVNLPALITFVVLVLVAWMIFSALMGGMRATIISSIIAGSGLAFLSIFVTVILMAVLYVIRDFAWRYIALEGMRTMESLRAGWALLRREWRNIGLMWLIMIGIRIGLALVVAILVLPLLVVSAVTAIGGLAAAVLPALAAAGVSMLFSAPDYWPWIFAAIVGAPLFFLITFSPILLVTGWAEIYISNVWTLTYRELKAIEMVRENGQSAPPELQDAPEEVEGPPAQDPSEPGNPSAG